jgi:hypothetical protein
MGQAGEKEVAMRTALLVSLSLVLVATTLHPLVAARDLPIPASGKPRLSAPVVYENLMLVVTGKEGVAAIDFLRPVPEGIRYRWRYLPNDGAEEVQGEDKVFEKYRREPGDEPNGQEAVGEGSRLHIEAGTIKMEWSLGGESSGWIYYEPESLRVQIVHEKHFEKLDLGRFRW